MKDADGQLNVKLEFANTEECAVYRKSNEMVEENEYRRPTRPNGFAYRCLVAGTTGYKEPLWPTVAALTVRDGSVTWTTVSAGTYGVNAITSPSATSDPVGMTIGSVSVGQSTSILATYTGGTEDLEYDAVFTFTMGGLTYVSRQAVKIRKR